MARHFKKSFFAAVLMAVATAFCFSPAATASSAPPPKSQEKQPDQKELIYTLDHAVIPGILFSDKGDMFFNDLTSGNTGPFLQIVEGPLGKAYASGIRIIAEHQNDFDIVVFSFPPPVEEPNNYQAALVRKKGTYRYITLERGNDVGNTGAKAFLCEWTADHTHKNYGPRTYDDLASFRKELAEFLKQQ